MEFIGAVVFKPPDMFYLHYQQVISSGCGFEQMLATNLESTRDLYEKVLGETEDYMLVLNSRKKDQTEYEDIIR